MTDYRLLITGNNKENKSLIVSSAPIYVNNYFVYQPGFSVEVFWRTSADTIVGEPFKSTSWDDSSILPKPAGTSSMIVTFPPMASSESSESVNLEDMINEIKERLPGLAETFEAEPPGYHITNTIDYVVLLEGEIKLVLDNEIQDLKVGDIVVQNGTRHAWINDSQNLARLLVIMVGVERK
jgi:mannose-6-phosphate isomerase-like protein (cupin superfamily)